MDSLNMLQVIMKAVRLGSLVASRAQQEFLGKGISKADSSPVTAADFAVQAVISYVLLQEYPGIKLLAEEDDEVFMGLSKETRMQTIQRVCEVLPELDNDETKIASLIGRGSYGKDPKDRPPAFVLDPIDGTKGYIRGEQYAICLGYLEKDGNPTIGCIGCPNLPLSYSNPKTDDEVGYLFEALRGHGARMHKLFLKEGEEDVVLLKLSPKPTDNIKLAESYVSSHTVVPIHDVIFKEFKKKDSDVIRIDSQCKFGLLARGDAQIYPRFTTFDQCIWDVLPGYVILVEAGGKVTDGSGKALNFNLGRTIKCAQVLSTCSVDPLLHQTVLNLVDSLDDVKKMRT